MVDSCFPCFSITRSARVVVITRITDICLRRHRSDCGGQATAGEQSRRRFDPPAGPYWCRFVTSDDSRAVVCRGVRAQDLWCEKMVTMVVSRPNKWLFH